MNRKFQESRLDGQASELALRAAALQFVQKYYAQTNAARSATLLVEARTILAAIRKSDKALYKGFASCFQYQERAMIEALERVITEYAINALSKPALAG